MQSRGRIPHEHIMKRRLRWLLSLTLLAACPAFASDVVISEIMYHPTPEMPEDTRLEWIELHNKSAAPVNLDGWRFTKGINFGFSEVSIPAGGYLVVAANVAAFQGRYPTVANVVGDWTGTLSNNGEDLHLRNAAGDLISSVSYGSQGDWAVRLRGRGERQVTSLTRSGSTVTPFVFGHDISSGNNTVKIYGADQPEYNGIFSINVASSSTFTYSISGTPDSPATGTIICRQLTDLGYDGWAWSSLADGLGCSMELMNENLPEQDGQNWTSSAVLGGTPGQPNSRASTDIAPMILDARHFPPVPRSTDFVAITARLVDEHTNGVTATLYYRDVSTASPPPFTGTPMFDDGEHGDGAAGDGVYGAVIPPLPNLTIIEFYIEAGDLEGATRAWPAPARDSNDNPIQQANALFQVDDSTYSGNQPIYRIIMTEAERAYLRLVHDNQNRSDATMNATFISIDGAETSVRYNVGIRNRGAGTRSAWPMNYRVSFPNDHTLNGLRGMHLNTQFTHAQLAGYALALRSGIDTEAARVVQVRVNGMNLAGAGSPQFGSYVQLEDTDSDYSATHYPNDPNGNIYRGSSGNHNATMAWRGTDPSAWQGSGPGYFKASNVSENDWTDLLNLSLVLNTNTPDDAVYAAAVRQVVNVEQWMRNIAVFQLNGSGETALQIGQGDDYALYRGLKDPRFVLLAHDWDTILNQGSGPAGYTRNLFTMCPFQNGNANVPFLNRFMTNAYFAPIYYRQLKDLLDTSFYPENVNATLDQMLGDWVPASNLNIMKSWASDRYTWVRPRIPLALTVTSSLTFSNGIQTTYNPTITLNGVANAIETRSVLVNGIPASWTAWQAQWTLSGIPVRPGVNRILVQAVNTNGVVFDSATIDIWYERGGTTAVAGGTLASSATWYATNSPYQVNGSITVPSGVTLTIQPGATVILAGGANITVTGSGRLLAEGNTTNHLRFTRLPGGANWGSLDFISATNESRLAYVDIEFCGGSTIGGYSAEVHVNGGSRIFFDHVTFASTPAVEYISFDGSSFIVQNCTFPTYPYATSAPEMLHGVNGIPAGGYGIFRDNYFGHTWGYNDTIDFTGGNRPGPILQFINNVFDGASDDHLDLDSTDAWIEGNIFMHAHRDPNRTDDPLDTSSAISGGVDVPTQYSEWTVINNFFYDVDHACLNKGGGRFIFVNNTLVHVNKESGAGLTNDIAAFDFTDVNVALPDPSVGAGAYVAGNIIWDCPQLTANYNPANHTVIFENNLLSVPWTGPGTNNVVADPQLNLQLLTNIATADWQTVKAAFTPRAGSPALGTGLGGFDKGGMNPAGLLIYGGPAGTTRSTSATLNLTPGGVFYWGSVVPPYVWGYTHYKWKLDNGPWSAEISITNSPTISLTNLSAGSHTVYVTGKNDAGYYQDDTFVYPANGGIPAHVTASRTWTVDPTAPGRVVLNEILASNGSAVPVGGRYPDLIELYNDSPNPADLSGLRLTDDPANSNRFVFPSGTTLGAGEYLVVYADNPNGTPGWYLGFNLNKDEGGVYLYDSAAHGGALLDSVVYGPQVTDWSIGRLANGQWALTIPTFGAANVAAPLGNPMQLKLNEWLTAELTAYPSDFVELYNSEATPVSLSGLYLTDNLIGWPTQHLVAPLCFIPANGFAVFAADGDPAAGAAHLNFQLSRQRGVIALLAPNLALIDQVLYGPQATDISLGRTPDGSTTLGFFTQPTPGAPNPGTGPIITISNHVVNLFGFTDKQWRYDNSGTDFGTAWRQPDYDDSGWDFGYGLFGYESSSGIYPYAFQTFIPPPNQGGGHLTVYYRTHFQWTNGPGFALVSTNYLDDGAVYYLNGHEVARVRISDNPVTYNSTAANQTAEGTAEYVPLLAEYLADGDNVLAVEVHQPECCGSGTSSDDVFGMTLAAVKTFTNITYLTVMINEVMANNLSVNNEDGSITDWVELYNPSTNLMDLAGMALSDSSHHWVFPDGVTLGPDSYLKVRFDGGSVASVTNGPVLNTGFGLKAEGEKVVLSDNRGGAPLDMVAFGLQAPDFSIGRIPSGSGAWTLNLPTPGAANIAASPGSPSLLKINEWMASPNNGADWFELYNPNAQPVLLSGLYLTDDLNNPDQYRIPPLSFVGTGEGGYAQFFADSSPAKGANHVNFKMAGNTGEAIGLFSDRGLLIDSISFGPQDSGISEGRFPDGSTNIVRFPGTATPGASNLRMLQDVVINEVLSHSDLPLEDALELYNLTTGSLDLSGWYLSDDKNDPRRFRIPDGTIIQPGGYVVFYEWQFNPTPGFLPSFALSSAHGENLYLLTASPDGSLSGYRAETKFGAAASGVSIGRYETSVGVDFTALSQRSFGVDSPADVQQFRQGAGGPNAYPLVGPVVINEIMYHPPEVGTNDNVADEFIELRNLSGAAVPLYDPAYPTNTWRLRDAVDFDFPPGTSLPAGGYLLVVSFDPATNAAALAEFRLRYGLGDEVRIFGPYDGKLANNGENIELYKPDEPVAEGADLGYVPYVLADKVKYDQKAPWPVAADGATNGVGLSLQRRVGAEYGNDPVNWLAGVPTPGAATGTAADTLPAIVVQPQSQEAAPGSSVSLSVSATGAGPLSYQWRFNGAELSGATNATLVLNNVQLTNSGVYKVLVANSVGATLSAAAVLTVPTPPLITQQPYHRSVAPGGTVSFWVTASGTVPLSYQWQFNGADLPAQTNAVLVISNAQLNSEGLYSVVVANAYGSVTSEPANLTLSEAPLILAQPRGTNVFVGATVTFSVVATGHQPLRYQWRFNSANIPGATNTTYTITNAQVSQSGNYRVLVTNDVGMALSDPAPLVVTIPPAITVAATDPAASETGPDPGAFTISRTGDLNTPLAVYFAVSGTATPVSDYELPTSPVTIPAGAASIALALVPVDDSVREASESVTLTLSPSPQSYVLGSATNATVIIADNDNVLPSVTITDPVNGTRFLPPTNIIVGVSATPGNGSIAKVELFANAAIGTTKVGEISAPPYIFTWTNPPMGSHVLTAVATDDVGATASSAPVRVLVASRGFADMFAERGQLSGYTNYVTANSATYTREPGEPRHTYDGFGNGTHSAWVSWTAPSSDLVTMDTFGSGFDTILVIYTNAPPTIETLTNLVKVAANDDSGSGLQSKVAFNAVAGITYHIAVDGYGANAGGSIVFHLSLPSPYPIINVQPASQLANPGATVTFGVVASGPGPLSYQWQFNGANLPGATNFTLVLTNVRPDNAGTYTVVVANAAGSVTSAGAVLTLRVPPVITTPLTNQVVDPGSNVIFRVSATGDAPLNYQWRFNGTNISGATANILVRSNVQHTNGGTYAVIVSNPAGSATNQAELIVRPVVLSWQGANGLCQVWFRGTPGRSYGVEVSTNLVDWIGAGTVTHTEVLMPYEEPMAPGPVPWFYRLRVLP